MACIITYENKQYTQKEFEQYFKEHFTEFVGEFITTKPDVILPIGTSGSGKSTFIKSLRQENLVIIEPDAMRVEFTGNMNDKSKDKEIYIEAANRAIKAIKQGKQVVFDTTNLTKDKRLPFIEAIKKAIPNANIQYKLMELNPELAKQRIKAQLERGENRAVVSDETIDRHAVSYKQMLKDIKNEPITEYKELGSKQDIEGFKSFADQSSFTQSLPSKNVVVSKDEVIFADGSVIPTPNEAPQTAQFKKDLLALNERVKQMAPFIFDEESLADFKYAVHELKDSMVFKSVSALEVSNPELVHMTDLIKTIDKSILAVDSVVYDLTPEEMNSRIREVMSRDIDDKDLPNVDPSGTNLSTLLVLFHQAKNLGGSLKELEGSIVSKFITEEAMIDFDAEVMEIVNRPILSMEGIFKAMAEVQALKDKGFISPETLENAQSIMTKKAADAEKLRVAAETINRGVQPGEQLDLFGTDYEGVAMDSAIETVEELPVGRAKEKIDSILDSLRIFLPLEGGESVSNKNQALVSKKRLNEAIKKADLEHAAAVSFIVNKETRELAMEDYIKLKELVISEVDSKVDYFNKQESNRDMSIATPENLFPAFVDSDKAQGVNLTPEAKEFIEGFTSKNKSAWVSFLNSEVSYEQNKQDLEDLFYAIDKAANDDISEQIITYMERKNDDSNCK